MNLELIIKVGYALGIGILLGMERTVGIDLYTGGKTKSRSKNVTATTDLIGVRTFSVLSLLGFLGAFLGSTQPALAAALIGGAAILIILMYWKTHDLGYGITTEAAAVATCGLGALCYTDPNAAGAIALIITIVLASKRFMRSLVGSLRRVELTDTLKFLVIIVVLLPLLPNQTLDPFNAFNPYKVAFLIVLISGISFVGYFLTKFLGPEKGLGLTGFLGGITSSTAVTAAMANHIKTAPSLQGPCAFATVLANATMFARVLIVVGILDRQLALTLAWSIGTMCAFACIAVIALWITSRKRPKKEPEALDSLSLTNPFSIGPAIKFALFFVGIIFLSKIGQQYFGDSGLYLASFVSGLADVDAITLSIAEQTGIGQLGLESGAIAITIAVVSNSVVKSGIALYSGNLRYGLLIGTILLSSTAAGLLVLVLART